MACGTLLLFVAFTFAALEADDNTLNICKANCEDPEYGFTCCAAASTLKACHFACDVMVKGDTEDECKTKCQTAQNDSLDKDEQREACAKSCEEFPVLKLSTGREGLMEKKRAPIDITACDATPSKGKYTCTNLIDDKTGSSYWDSDNTIPNKLKLLWEMDELKLATSVVLKIYPGYYPSLFKVEGTTDNGETSFPLTNLHVDSETNYDTEGPVGIRDDGKVQNLGTDLDLELVFDPVMVNGLVLTFLGGQKTNNRILLYDVFIFEEVEQHCPSGYFPVGSMGKGNKVATFGSAHNEFSIEDCAERCDYTATCISFMYDLITRECKTSKKREVKGDVKYNTRLCVRSLAGMICPAGYEAINSLYNLNNINGVGVGFYEGMDYDTIEKCKAECDDHDQCKAFNFDDEANKCYLEKFRRPSHTTNDNTRYCALPLVECIAPYTQRGTYTEDNKYSKTLETLKGIITTQECQTWCDEDFACAAYRFDDETQICILQPSRTPNKDEAPNSLYCVQAVDYTYEGCGSVDFEPICDEGSETLYVGCKEMLDSSLPVDDRARHCQQMCLESNQGYNYISIHDDKKCYCKKAKPVIKDTETNEEDCEANPVYRIVVEDVCTTQGGENVCGENALCTNVNGTPQCACRSGFENNDGSCDPIRNGYNVCVASCERAEFEYTQDLFQACEIACEFSIMKGQTPGECKSSCMTVEDEVRLENDDKRAICSENCDRMDELLKPIPDHKQSYKYIKVETCESVPNDQPKYTCDWAFDENDAGNYWDSDDLIPAYLDGFWTEKKIISKVVLVFYGGYEVERMELEYTTDKGESWKDFTNVELDTSQFELKSHRVRDDKKIELPDAGKVVAVNLESAEPANGIRMKVLDGERKDNRVLVYSFYVFETIDAGCPDGYTMIGTLSKHNKVATTGTNTKQENVERCARWCDLYDDCVAFMYDDMRQDCKMSFNRFPSGDQKYTQRFCARNNVGTICPPGYLQHSTLNKDNIYSTKGIKQIAELPVISDCKDRCDDFTGCKAFSYDDKTGHCQLEGFRRADKNRNYNTRSCELPVVECIAPYFQKGTMDEDNKYSKDVGVFKGVYTVDECQVFCDAQFDCAAYRFDDEKQICTLQPSRSPDKYESPNSLFCAQSVDYTYVGCASLDFDPLCEENSETLLVHCDDTLDKSLPVDDRARHCQQMCLELNQGYNYISIHDKTKCLCKKAKPLVKDDETDEEVCDSEADLTNVVYRIVVEDPCSNADGSDVCPKNSVCTNVDGVPTCACRTGFESYDDVQTCELVIDYFNVCTTGCEKAEYEYDLAEIQSCQAACEFSIQQEQSSTECKTSCLTVEDDRLSKDEKRNICRDSCDRMNELLTVIPEHKESFEYIKVTSCKSQPAKAKYLCDEAFDEADSGGYWDNDYTIPAYLDGFWEQPEVITKVLFVMYSGYQMERFELEYTTDEGDSWKDFTSFELDDSQFEVDNFRVRDDGKISMLDGAIKFAINVVTPEPANGIRLKVLDAKRKDNRVLIYSWYIFKTIDEGCPDGYTMIGTLSQNNKNSNTNGITQEQDVDRCARRCDLYNDCVAFMFDDMTKDCKISYNRFPNNDEMYTQRFCARNNNGMICPPGYFQRGSLNKDNKYSAKGIAQIDELPTIADCLNRCEDTPKCRGFMYDDKTGFCQLENYRRADSNRNYNTRSCQRPVEECPEPYFQKGTLSTGNLYNSKILNKFKDIDDVATCQQFCEDDNQCASYNYDDETWKCETQASRTPNTKRAPNTLFCAAPAPYMYLGCGSTDFDYECGENDVETLYVDCKPILDKSLAVDDRARHCHRRCMEQDGDYKYISVHKKTQCICKRNKPIIIDTATDENDCGISKDSKTRLNVIYRMDTGENACDVHNGGCHIDAICSLNDHMEAVCNCRKGYIGNGYMCEIEHDMVNLCTARCENPEFEYTCCGKSSSYTLHGCHWACEFMNGPEQMSKTECRAHCDVREEVGLSHDKHRAACRESCDHMEDLIRKEPIKEEGYTPILIESCKASSEYSRWYTCAQAINFNKASYGWYTANGDYRPTIELSWPETKNIERIVIVCSGSYNMRKFKLEHAMGDQDWQMFDNLEVDHTQYPFENARAQNEYVYVDMKNKKEIELKFDRVDAKEIKITAVQMKHYSGRLRIMEVFVYEHNKEVCPEGYIQIGTLAQHNKASGTKSTRENVQQCKIQCELYDKCASFSYDNLRKECKIHKTRLPTHDSKTNTQRFCYRDLDDTICPTGYFQVGSLTRGNRVTKKNLDEELQVATIHDCEDKCSVLKLCKAFTYDSHKGHCQAENIRTPNSWEAPNTRMCALDPLQCPPKYTQKGTLNSGNSWSGNGLGILKNIRSIEDCHTECQKDPKCIGFQYNDELLKCELDPSRTPNQNMAGSYLFCGQDINYEYMGCGSYSFEKEDLSCTPGDDVFHVQCKTNLLTGTVENKAMICYNYCSQLDDYNYMSVHNRGSCLCKKTKPTVKMPLKAEEDCKESKSDAVYKIFKRPCLTNNGGCHANADCIELEENAMRCECREGYEGNGYDCSSDMGNCESSKVTASCLCAGVYCGPGKYCWGGACRDHPMRCPSGSLISDHCACGDNECDNGEYCYDGECHSNPKTCDIDDSAKVTESCVCGTETCAAGFQLCFELDGELKCHSNPKCGSGTTLEQCHCGDAMCNAGQKCTDGVCITDHPDCEIGALNDRECKCAGNLCDAGTYCSQDECTTDLPDCGGHGLITSDCTCAERVCPQGKFCINEECSDDPIDCTENETLQTGETCMCGTDRCDPIEFCYNGECQTDPVLPDCTFTNGVLEQDCVCGDVPCPTGKYCTSASTCTEEPPINECIESGSDVITNKCKCGEVTCPWGSYCYDGECSSEPKDDDTEDCDGSGRVEVKCKCSNTVCEEAEYCYNDTCNREPDTCSDQVANSPIIYECKCGAENCPPSHYCSNGVCSENPTDPTCSTSGVKELTADCDCYGESCPTGSYCTSEGCVEDKLQCGEDPWHSVPEACMCGNVVCNGVCFDGTCEGKPREHCTEGLVILDNWPMQYGKEGQYAGFDDAAAEQFFGTTGYSKNEFVVRNSRGYRGVFKPYKHSSNCGFCGRYDPKDVSDAGDWQAGDIICHNDDEVIEPAPEPYPLENCANALQVTNSHPGKYMTPGRYFGFDNECMDLFYGFDDWHYKKIKVEAPDGRTGYIRLLKNNPNCKMSCARWDPKSLADTGDWNLNDLVIKIEQPHNPEMCDDQFQIISTYSSQKYGCVDNECMEKFLEIDEGQSWPKTALVKTEASKEGKIRLFKDSNSCGCSCIRWDPRSSAKDKDWTNGDLVFHLLDELPEHPIEECDHALQVIDDGPGRFSPNGRYFGLDPNCRDAFFGGTDDNSVTVDVEVSFNGMHIANRRIVVFKQIEQCTDCGRIDPYDDVEQGQWRKGMILTRVCSNGISEMACMCGVETCPAGNSCNQGQCHAPDGQEEDLCGSQLVVKSDGPGSYRHDGKYFGVDEECRKKFFGDSTSNSVKANVKVTLDGNLVKETRIVLWNSAKKCQNCGRTDPSSASKKGDWKYGMVITRICSDSPSSLYACMCGSTQCAIGEKCNDGECVSVCEGSGEVLESACTCGTSLCEAGSSCEDGICSRPRKVCDPVEKPSNVLEIVPILDHTNAPGKYFKFDDAEAKAYFGTSSYSGSNQMLMNSCGELKAVNLYRNAGGCDQTSDKLFCGRNSDGASEDDWDYEQHESAGETMWIALPPNGKCTSDTPSSKDACEAIIFEGQCESSDNDDCTWESDEPVHECVPTERPERYLEIWPVSGDSQAEGFHFQFDRTAAETYFEVSWRYGGTHEFLTSCGDTIDLRIYRKSRNCGTSSEKIDCGKKADSPEAGDWLYADQYTENGEKRWIALTRPINSADTENAIAEEKTTTFNINFNILALVALALILFIVGYYRGRTQKKKFASQPLIKKNNVELSRV